jgi:anti-sigma B factor antagonist
VGELDMATADELVRALEPAIATAGGDLTLDLSDLTFIDSSGLRALLEVSQRLNGGGRLVLSRPSEAASKVFELVRIETFPNIELASTG